MCVCDSFAFTMLSVHGSLVCSFLDVYMHTCLQHGTRYHPRFARGSNPGENKIRSNVQNELVSAMKSYNNAQAQPCSQRHCSLQDDTAIGALGQILKTASEIWQC